MVERFVARQILPIYYTCFSRFLQKMKLIFLHLRISNTLRSNDSQFPQTALELLDTLEGIGGAVFVDDIQIKCPDDATPRNVGGLAFKIKALE
jgi:hypothetical protein